MSKLASAISNRSRGKAQQKKRKDGAPFQHATEQIGPFSVYFSAHHKKEKGADGKERWVPTGELSMKVEVSDSFPKTTIGFNHEGKGPLSTIVENLEDFNTAVMRAVELWGDDAIFTAAETALDAHIAKIDEQIDEQIDEETAKQIEEKKPATGGLVNRVRNRAG